MNAVDLNQTLIENDNPHRSDNIIILHQNNASDDKIFPPQPKLCSSKSEGLLSQIATDIKHQNFEERKRINSDPTTTQEKQVSNYALKTIINFIINEPN